jgi:hypothetical protein
MIVTIADTHTAIWYVFSEFPFDQYFVSSYVP